MKYSREKHNVSFSLVFDVVASNTAAGSVTFLLGGGQF